MVNIFEAYAKEYNNVINASKSKLMHFGHKSLCRQHHDSMICTYSILL